MFSIAPRICAAMTRNCSRWRAHRDARAYVVHRDSLVVKQEADGPRALLTIDEALKFGANPGTIFLGLRDGAAVFGMGISAAAVEKLLTRDDVAVTELRGMAMQGVVPPDQLSAIAMAKSMVSWHQRHGYLRQLRHPHRDEGRRLEARLPELQGRAFSAHRPGRDHAGDLGRQMPARAAEAIPAGHVFVPGRLRRSRRNHRGRGPPRNLRGIRHPLHRRELLHDAALALSVIPDDRMHRARHQRGYHRRPHGTGRCALVRPRRGDLDDQAAASRRPRRTASLCDCPSFAGALAA